MADVAYPGATGMVGVTEGASFIPEVWSDEIRASYEMNLVMANIVKKMSMKGKKGDTLHVPAPVRGSAYAKAENTAVTIQANTEGTVDISIDRHFEYSRLIENIVEVQALSSLRRFYTDDAGYALATQTDTDLLNCGTGLGDGTLDLAPDGTGGDWAHSACFYASAASTLSAYAVDTVTTGDDMTDYHLRALIRRLDDQSVPMADRFFIIPPILCETLRGIDRFVSSDFVGSGKVSNGKIGNLYGVDVYVSANCPVIETAAANSAHTADTRGAIMGHRDTFVLAEQMSVRSQKQRKQEYLADLYTADCLYGVQVLRPDAGVVFAVPE